MTNPLLAYDPSGRVFALALNDSVIKLYATSNQGAGPFLSKHISDPSIYPPPRWTKISFSADGKYILISTNAGVLYLVDAFEVDILHKLTGHLNSEGIAFQGCFTPDAKYVMCGMDLSDFRISGRKGPFLGRCDWDANERKHGIAINAKDRLLCSNLFTICERGH